jgi:saccharopine dehydrogenase (NADP+, L-glutamate forming)
MLFAFIFRRAKAAGLTFLNEVGVDPGIDHFYALKTIDEVHSEGGKVRNWCLFVHLSTR